ncbi:hypothetical protein FCV25MIE_05276 [Fagus crenata]
MIRDNQQTWDEALQTAAEAWHLLRQREAMDQSESCVLETEAGEKVVGDVSKVDLMKDGARGTTEVPAINLLSLQTDLSSESSKLESNSSSCILEIPVNTEPNGVNTESNGDVGPVPILLASPSNKVEIEPTSSIGLEIQRLAPPIINVDHLGPIMDVLNKRKASGPELEAHTPKKPKVSLLSYSNPDLAYSNSNRALIKSMHKKKIPGKL